METHTFRHHRLIGTTVDVRVIGVPGADAERIAHAVAEEMGRLEAVFNAYDDRSELCRWRSGGIETPSVELAEVLTASIDWQRRSSGRFNPLAGVLVDRWRAAERVGVAPTEAELASIAASIAEPRVELSDGVPVRTADCSGLVLNAIAKGYIVARALDAAARPDATVVVNAGGDLAHRGSHPIDVAIENPLRPYDNEPPLTTVRLADAAIATSGRARRGVRIAGRRHSHVIDPRTGRPAADLAAVSVLADDAMTADVVATILNLTAPADVVAEAERFGVSCLAVTADGSHLVTDGFGRPA